MTNEQARKMLKRMSMSKDLHGDEVNAINVAIEALKPKTADSGMPEIKMDRTTDGLIKRQDAIDAFDEMLEDGYVATYKGIIAKLNALPSAQPETHEERTETHACDLISRQAAIDAFYNATSDGDKAEWCDYMLCQVPSAQPELGEWIVYEVANTEEVKPIAWECSECGEVVSYRYNFCPECGDQKIPLDPLIHKPSEPYKGDE